tara:strand:+ start:12619 stop:13197 length:579 start_codon:yes stop_codon:yes gene_type:complete
MAINPGAYDLKIQRRADYSTRLVFKNEVEVKTSSVNTVTNVFTVTGHGYSNGDGVQYLAGTGSAIGGLTNETIYYVRDKTDDTFKLEASVGGSVIALTSQGNDKQKFKADTDMTGNLVISQVWDAARTSKAADFTVTYTDPSNGIITLSLTDTQTATLTGEEYRYDVLVSDGSGLKEYYLEGVIYMSQGYSS